MSQPRVIDEPVERRGRRGTVRPSVVLGIGFGGFVDGIVFHQLLQWHHMLTATDDHRPDTVAGLETNVLADGLFHVATWFFVFVGTWMLFQAWRDGDLAPPWRRHLGGLLVGWGLFNVVEGIVNHHILQIHHVRDDVAEPLGWDLAFLVAGALLLAVGALMMRSEPDRREVV